MAAHTRRPRTRARRLPSHCPSLGILSVLIEKIEWGMQVHRSRVKETGDRGYEAFKQEYIEGLRRYSFVATLIASDGGTERRRLLDADIGWMGQDRFALKGLNQTPAHHEKLECCMTAGGLACSGGRESRRQANAGPASSAT